MFKLMTIIVQTTLITRTKGFANVAKHVIRNITTLSFNFQFQCINCPWFVAINVVLKYPHKKKSMGVRSGERAGYSVGPLRPIHGFSNSGYFAKNFAKNSGYLQHKKRVSKFIMVINLNICEHDSSITFISCIRCYFISLYVHK